MNPARVWRVITGRSVIDLAGEVDAALARLEEARIALAQYEEAREIARSEYEAALSGVAAARDALFTEHPALAPSGWGERATLKEDTPVTHPTPASLLPGQDPEMFEVVEVDDSDDPRFTAGAPVSASDTDDLPPIVWEEHDA